MLCFSKGPPKYFKSVLKKGDKTNFPKKGENVSCWYTGSLVDGTVFDTNIPTSRPHSYPSPNYFRLWWAWPVISLCPSPLNPTAARKKKQSKPLSFKIGMGRVIRGVSDPNGNYMQAMLQRVSLWTDISGNISALNCLFITLWLMIWLTIYLFS